MTPSVIPFIAKEFPPDRLVKNFPLFKPVMVWPWLT